MLVAASLARTPRTDLVLALALCAIGVVDVLTTRYVASPVVALTAVALQTLPLVWRRTQPLWMVIVAVAGVAVEISSGAAYGDIAGNLALFVLVFSVARWAEGRHRQVAAGLLVAGIVAHVASQALVDPSIIGANVVIVGGAGLGLWWLGSSMRAGAARDRDSAAATARVIEAERRAIARDLHDVVGHALAGISLTAGAAQQQAGARDPEMAEALEVVSTLSRGAAADVRQLVGLLRQAGDELPTGPQPSLAALPGLVDRARTAGLDVTLRETGEPRPGAPGWQLAVYRVVQEGLTNALRHAPGAVVEVTLAWEQDHLDVSVADTAPSGSSGASHDGTAHSHPSPDLQDLGAGGHGLVGLRERVTLYGGSLTATPTPDGFLLTARMPIS